MSGMTWIHFGKVSLYVSRRANDVLTLWGGLIAPSKGGWVLSEWLESHQTDKMRDALQAQAILCAPAPVPLLDRAFLVGYYAFGRGPEELSAITGVPLEDTCAVMERAIRTFSLELASSDVERVATSMAA